MPVKRLSKEARNRIVHAVMNRERHDESGTLSDEVAWWAERFAESPGDAESRSLPFGMRFEPGKQLQTAIEAHTAILNGFVAQAMREQDLDGWKSDWGQLIQEEQHRLSVLTERLLKQTEKGDTFESQAEREQSLRRCLLPKEEKPAEPKDPGDPKYQVYLDLEQIKRDAIECQDAWEEKRWHSMLSYFKIIQRQLEAAFAKTQAIIESEES